MPYKLQKCPIKVTKVPYEVTKAPYQGYKSAPSRLQKCPIDEVTKVPYRLQKCPTGYKSALQRLQKCPMQVTKVAIHLSIYLSIYSPKSELPNANIVVIQILCKSLSSRGQFNIFKIATNLYIGEKIYKIKNNKVTNVYLTPLPTTCSL